MKLTQERLKELLHYDPETGNFTWAKTIGRRAKKGAIAGGFGVKGYWYIKINNKSYRAGRLAWLYMEGYFPENQIDHINRIKDDDRWKNLRHVSATCNTRNRGVFKNNTSGITGVNWSKEMKKWRAEIDTISGRDYLGCFAKKLDAVKARWNAEVKYKFPNCNTASTAYQYIQREAKG